MTRRLMSLVVLALFLAVPVIAQDKPLPRVLIAGDSVYAQHARDVSTQLKGHADVTILQTYNMGVFNSQTFLGHLDRALGRVDRNGKAVPKEKWPKWDLIHFNVGLGDLVYRAPNMKSFRVLPIHAGGVVATGPKQYAANLDKLVLSLKAKTPGAKLVWASTTPIRHSRSNIFRLGSEIEYNRIAAGVMKKHRVPINDMYGYARSIMNMDKPAGHGADPFNFDKKPISPPIVDAIARALKMKIDRPGEAAGKTAKKD